MKPFQSRIVFIALAVISVFVAGLSAETGKDSGSEYNSTLVDVSQLSITRVSASSVNGNRPLTDKCYGVLNLFDKGSNFINGINYTYWLTDAQLRHWVELTFLKPVTIYSVFVETTGENEPKGYGLEVCRVTKGLEQKVKDYDSITIKGFRTTYNLPEPVSDVNMIRIIFPGPEMIAVSEIKVMGQVMQGVDLTPQRPMISPIEQEVQGPHIIKVQRIIRTENDMRMINIAESTYPPRTEVLEAIKKAHFKLEEVPQDKLWWYSEFDGVRIPYAITAEAVDYYVNLVQGYRKREWKSDIEPSSQFTYSAEVVFSEHYEKNENKFQQVYVVNMKLSMRATFASLSAVGFAKERIVVLDRQGKVLAVFGDGETPFMVS
jgi:hypothetical protein